MNSSSNPNKNPFFSKDYLIPASSISESFILYQELGIDYFTKQGRISRATTRDSTDEGLSYLTLRILVREVEDCLVIEVVKIVHISLSLHPIILPLWDIDKLPLFDISIEGKTPISAIRRETKANIYTSLRKVHKLIGKYDLNKLDTSIAVFIHKGLEDIFKRLITRLNLKVKLVDSWEIGSKYLLMAPSLYDILPEEGIYPLEQDYNSLL